ncbi:MAG TPA: penicillin-binding transpeptidase domain-containing protein [Polyangiaceae bacterium]|nr:penicillin-binding transpeptidase domain-containing protein [Polyangiaceae bacterium]
MRPWIAIAAAAASVTGLVPVMHHRATASDGSPRPPAVASTPATTTAGSTAQAAAIPSDAQLRTASSAPPEWGATRAVPGSSASARASGAPPPLAGIDLTKIALHDDGATAPAPLGRVAHLTLKPDLQRATQRILREYALPEAAVVVLDLSEGKVLVWASHVQQGPLRDLCVESTAPAASIFKIVTAAALVETAGVPPDIRQCYSGGESRITSNDLVDDPKRDRWCATLGEAMGRSINTVFARLAVKNLTPPTLTSMAQAFGFGEARPFDVPVAVSDVHIPDDRLGMARTAAGFWNTTLSPLEGAMIAGTVANRGETLRPVLVESVADASGTLYEAPKRAVLRRTIRPETAAALTAMMETTTSNGTSHRAFRDLEGRAFLPNISVAGKTGSLMRAETQQFYTWFVGFAPSRAPEIAISVLAVNTPTWRAKANVIARDVLRAYFAARGASGVTRP